MTAVGLSGFGSRNKRDVFAESEIQAIGEHRALSPALVHRCFSGIF